MTNNTEIIGGVKYWYNSIRQYHREDGPAIESSNGAKEWWINGKRHRDDGPAIEYIISKYWYYNGIEITKEVTKWIYDNNLPDYKEWDDSIKVFFKLTFG